jgi:oxygen-independent coproporphyrinogen-3 oxidase
MYYYIIDYLKKNGYNHYEISNFGKDGYYSMHNLNYWNNLNYYGFGLSASGYIDDIRYTNTRSITNYLKGNYLLTTEKIDQKTKMAEEMICGLRKIEGVSKKEFIKKYNKNIKDVFEIEELLEKKLLLENDEYIFIPEDKLYISNSILVNFII